MTIKTLQSHIDIIMVQFSKHEMAKKIPYLTHSHLLYEISSVKDLVNSKTSFNAIKASAVLMHLLNMKQRLAKVLPSEATAFFKNIIEMTQEALHAYLMTDNFILGN